MRKSIVIGVDVGGTFTDILSLDEISGEVHVEKVPSTKGDQSSGFLSGIMAATNHDLSSVSTIIHGTTVQPTLYLNAKVQRLGLSLRRVFVMCLKCAAAIALPLGGCGGNSRL